MKFYLNYRENEHGQKYIYIEDENGATIPRIVDVAIHSTVDGVYVSARSHHDPPKMSAWAEEPALIYWDFEGRNIGDNIEDIPLELVAKRKDETD